MILWFYARNCIGIQSTFIKKYPFRTGTCGRWDNNCNVSRVAYLASKIQNPKLQVQTRAHTSRKFLCHEIHLFSTRTRCLRTLQFFGDHRTNSLLGTDSTSFAEIVQHREVRGAWKWTVNFFMVYSVFARYTSTRPPANPSISEPLRTFCCPFSNYSFYSQIPYSLHSDNITLIFLQKTNEVYFGTEHAMHAWVSFGGRTPLIKDAEHALYRRLASHPLARPFIWFLIKRSNECCDFFRNEESNLSVFWERP